MAAVIKANELPTTGYIDSTCKTSLSEQHSLYVETDLLQVAFSHIVLFYLLRKGLFPPLIRDKACAKLAVRVRLLTEWIMI